MLMLPSIVSMWLPVKGGLFTSIILMLEVPDSLIGYRYVLAEWWAHTADVRTWQ